MLRKAKKLLLILISIIPKKRKIIQVINYKTRIYSLKISIALSNSSFTILA